MLNVGEIVAQDGVMRPAGCGRGQSQLAAVPLKTKEDLGLGFEQVADELAGAVGPGVVAITGDVTLIGLQEGLESLRTDAAIVVAGEVPRAPCWGICHGPMQRAPAPGGQGGTWPFRD